MTEDNTAKKSFRLNIRTVLMFSGVLNMALLLVLFFATMYKISDIEDRLDNIEYESDCSYEISKIQEAIEELDAKVTSLPNNDYGYEIGKIKNTVNETKYIVEKIKYIVDEIPKPGLFGPYR